MPLDTQPLSRTRRLLLLVVMLAFFAAAIAFAQALVIRRTRAAQVHVDVGSLGFHPRHGESLPDEIAAFTGTVAGHPRRVDIFSLSTDGTPDTDDVQQAATDIFTQLMTTPPQEALIADLDGVAGIQTQGTAPDGRFAIVRAAAVDERIVAICYSGTPPYTDADKDTFTRLCASGVRLVTPPPSEDSHERQ